MVYDCFCSVKRLIDRAEAAGYTRCHKHEKLHVKTVYHASSFFTHLQTSVCSTLT